MPEFCDVAVPVPLHMVLTYRVPEGASAAVGSRVVVPFRRQRLAGVVTELHDRAPKATAKTVLEVLDNTPALSAELLRLGKWISEYYLAPVGEVFRSMLPLNAEFRRKVVYRIAEEGHVALHQAGTGGSSSRSKKNPEEQDAEYRALNYLVMRDDAREGTLRSATGVSRSLLAGMVRKKWIEREDVSHVTDATRTRQVAMLINEPCSGGHPRPPEVGPDDSGGGGRPPQHDQDDVAAGVHARPVNGTEESRAKLNSNQRLIIDALTAAGGKLHVETLRELDVPHSTLATLVKRGLVELVSEAIALPKSTVAPRGLRQGMEFHPAQQAALEKIRTVVDAKNFAGILLHGVTGSGKTAVYLAAMKSVLDAGRTAILLVPEIGLTPAVAADVHDVFGDEVAILHSGLSDKERAEHWHRIRRGEARAIVGTRSAVFAPVANLALIIVDEEQDSSYKQEETPRYHARDVAVMRAKFSDAVVVLGSATPSLESYFNAKKHRYTLVEMPDRVEKRPLPEVEVIDMRQEFQETGNEQVISRKLIEEIRLRLERKEQAMVLLNRRGYSPVVLCRTCGKKLECSNCAIALTHHKSRRRMECHYCGFMAPVPKNCAACGSEYVYFLGTGSEKLEELLHGFFPQARIARLDRDTVRSHADFERVLNALNAGELDLLVGTQMIAKGHDIHGVTLVGVVGADMALGLPDFRAAERTFQLLTQVAGRAGRGEVPGKVLLQTYFPDHYAVQYAAHHDFAGFYEKELRFRSWMHYPPYSSLANVMVRSAKLDETLRWSGALGRWFEKTRHEGVRVLGPAAAPIERLKRDYRYHFILKSPSRQQLNEVLRAMLAQADREKIPRTNVIVDVDALWLM
ncbi:MAG TPA: primosomal protein N' [Terriglobales bacterium]|jgi:primosomal protein N' (replication factor Y)|nr:primosomal protein N' [Terriglobales bacterium]